MCGLGNNHKVVNNNIKLITDLKKVSLISGKKKRKLILFALNSPILKIQNLRKFIFNNKINMWRLIKINLDGAHFLNDNENIINFTMEDDTKVNFCPRIRAKLLEINSKIFSNYNLINESVLIYFIFLFFI